MGLIGDIGGDIGSIAGLFAGGGTDDAAQGYYKQLIDKMGGVNPTITAEQSAPTALGGTGLDSRAAQMDALREMQGTYRAGGLDAGSRAALADATTTANRNASAQAGAIQEQARARGAGRSGVSLALQQGAGQNAMVNGNQQATEAAGLAMRNRNAAAAGAGTLSGAVRGGDYQVGTAADAVNQFNAQMRQGAQQQTYGNKMGQLEAEGNAYGGVYRSGKAGEDRTARLYGSIGKTLGTAGDAAASAFGGGGPSAADEFANFGGG